MERRKYVRFKTGSKYKGKLILTDEVTIKDISISGMCLKTSKRLTINKVYRIEIITRDKEKMLIAGLVVRSFLRGTAKREDELVPLYEVGLKFVELKESEKRFIEKIISELASN